MWSQTPPSIIIPDPKRIRLIICMLHFGLYIIYYYNILCAVILDLPETNPESETSDDFVTDAATNPGSETAKQGENDIMSTCYFCQNSKRSFPSL